MRIAVFGTGAVGGYFGGRLAESGEDVSFIARGEHLKAMRANGLRVDSINGDFVVKPVQATDNPTEVGPVDVILVGVKTMQIMEAAKAMRPLVGPETMILPLQNGLEASDQLAGVLGEQHTLVGLCGLFCLIAGPGHIRHAGGEPFVRFGEMDNSQTDRVEKLHKAFIRAGVVAEIPPDIHVALWMKFLFVTPFSGVGSVTRAPIGVLRSLPETRQMLKHAMLEIVAVARGRGIILSEDAMETMMARLDGLPPEVTASMQRDVMEGRPSELDAQIGAVVRLGLDAGVDTPLNTMIYNSLLPMEMRARGEVEFAS